MATEGYYLTLGRFRWRIIPTRGRWGLFSREHGDWVLRGVYRTPQLAAGDVYCQATGDDAWDRLPYSVIPSEIEDISEWERRQQ